MVSNATKAIVAGFEKGIQRALAAGNKAKAKFLKRSMRKTMANGR